MSPNLSTDRRSFVGATAAAAVLGLAGCSSIQGESETSAAADTELWQDPKDGQREVLLLGTHHFAGSEGDAVSIELDILNPTAQRALEDLTDRFTEWEPDAVAVEKPPAEQDQIEQAYEAWQNENLGAVPESLSRKSEIVQVGGRLVDKLGHEKLLAVDHELALQWNLENLPAPDSVSYPMVNPQEKAAEFKRKVRELPLEALFRYLNRPAQRRVNDTLLVATAMEASKVGEYAEAAVTYYQRNMRIAANLWNRIEPETERVLLLIGASHVPSLRRILNQAPMFAPVSPLPFLET